MSKKQTTKKAVIKDQVENKTETQKKSIPAYKKKLNKVIGK